MTASTRVGLVRVCWVELEVYTCLICVTFSIMDQLFFHLQGFSIIKNAIMVAHSLLWLVLPHIGELSAGKILNVLTVPIC